MTATKGGRRPSLLCVLSVALSASTVGCASSAAGITGNAGASACGECHSTEYAAWSTSRLASSGTSPVFTALSTSAASAWGEAARARCVSCHKPGTGGDHGIGCVSCHSATGNLANRDGLLTIDLDAPVRGPFYDPIPTPAHGSAAGGFLVSPDLCGTCHEVTGPGLLHETTLDEYSASPAAADGATCATCHMPAISPGPIAVGEAKTRARSDHSFVGLDPPWGAAADVQEAAASRTLGLLRTALTLAATQTADGAGLDVTVTNAAGHAVPTGPTFLRSIWVDVDITGAEGSSAAVSSVVHLGAQPTRMGVPVAMITEADTVVPNALAAGAALSVYVAVPSSVAPPWSAVVTLRARAIRPAVLHALGLGDAGAEVPTHEIAVVRVGE